jgi:hypothetical protein
LKFELNSVSQIDGSAATAETLLSSSHFVTPLSLRLCVGSAAAWVQYIHADLLFSVVCVFLITSSAALHSAVNLEIAIKQPTAFWVCVALCARPTPKGAQLRQKITFSNKEIKTFFVCCTGGDFPVAFYLRSLDTRAIKRQKVIGLLAERFDAADGIGRDLQ